MTLLKTLRLILSPCAPVDRVNFIQLELDPEVMRFLNNGAVDHDRIDSTTAPFLMPRGTEPNVWTARRNADDEFVGWFCLLPKGRALAEIGYRLRREAWGQGLATEGALALIGWGFEVAGYDKIVANTMAVNQGSRRVMEMGWMPLSPLTASRCAILVVSKHKLKERASMEEVSIIGVDLAKNVFQLHGAGADGAVVFRKKLSRQQFAGFMADHPACDVAMEACPSAHHWARELTAHGHRVRLIAPHYVKPFIKRQKNDAADAEAIAEAATRPTMRFVEPKTEEQQARAVAFRAREQIVKQRTEAINALRAHLYEFGHVAPEGVGYIPRLAKVVDDPGSGLPDLARDICRMVLEQIDLLSSRLAAVSAKLAAASKAAAMPRQLQTMPGVGPITALAVETFAPPMEQFRRGRDFAAWLGLVPRQHSSGGKQRLGKTSKMGQRDIRRLLVTGAMAVVRWALRRGAPQNPWLERMLERKPPLVAAFALANKMARGIWAMLTRGEGYRDPVIASAA